MRFAATILALALATTHGLLDEGGHNVQKKDASKGLRGSAEADSSLERAAVGRKLDFGYHSPDCPQPSKRQPDPRVCLSVRLFLHPPALNFIIMILCKIPGLYAGPRGSPNGDGNCEYCSGSNSCSKAPSGPNCTLFSGADRLLEASRGRSSSGYPPGPYTPSMRQPERSGSHCQVIHARVGCLVERIGRNMLEAAAHAG